MMPAFWEISQFANKTRGRLHVCMLNWELGDHREVINAMSIVYVEASALEILVIVS